MNTNQDTTLTNQDEAFNQWFDNESMEGTGRFFDVDRQNWVKFVGGGLAKRAWQAATQASESEINSLKERVAELQADNNQLREALEIARDYQFYANQQFHIDFEGYKEDEHAQYDADLANTDKALSSTPAQSLVERDNATIDSCKNIVADDALAITFQSMGAYRSAIIKHIGELKATP